MGININFKPELIDQVRRVAEREGKSEHAVVEEIIAQIRSALGGGKKPRLKIVGGTEQWKPVDSIAEGEPS